MSEPRRASLTSADWLLEQQMRAEIEAEAWRRLREELVLREPPKPAAVIEADPHRTGSTILKALVRFAIAALGAYLAFLAAVDSQLGEFEVWLAIGAAFMVTLALTAFGPLRKFVHMLAETARWALILAFGFGALWLLLNPPPSL